MNELVSYLKELEAELVCDLHPDSTTLTLLSPLQDPHSGSCFPHCTILFI